MPAQRNFTYSIASIKVKLSKLQQNCLFLLSAVKMSWLIVSSFFLDYLNFDVKDDLNFKEWLGQSCREGSKRGEGEEKRYMAFLALFQFSLRLIPASEFTILQTGFNGMGGVQNTALPLSKYKLSILESANLNFFEHPFGQKEKSQCIHKIVDLSRQSSFDLETLICQSSLPPSAYIITAQSRLTDHPNAQPPTAKMHKHL